MPGPGGPVNTDWRPSDLGGAGRHVAAVAGFDGDGLAVQVQRAVNVPRRLGSCTANFTSVSALTWIVFAAASTAVSGRVEPETVLCPIVRVYLNEPLGSCGASTRNPTVRTDDPSPQPASSDRYQPNGYETGALLEILSRTHGGLLMPA